MKIQELGSADEPGEISYLIDAPGGLAQIDVATFEALYAADGEEHPMSHAAGIVITQTLPRAKAEKKLSGWQKEREAAKPPHLSTQRVASGPDDPIPVAVRIRDCIRLAIHDGPKKIAEIRAWLKWRGAAFNAEAVAGELHELVLAGEVTFDSDAKFYQPTKKLKAVEESPFDEGNQRTTSAC